MKKTWKAILIGMLVVTLLALSACNSTNLSEACVVGYSEKPFEQALDDYAKLEAESGEVLDYSIEWTDGWQSDDAPQDYVLVAGQEKVTCTLTVSLMDETNEMVLYFVQNTDENTLLLKGGYMTDDGSKYSISEHDTEEMMEMFYELDV